MNTKVLHVLNYGWPYIDGYTARSIGLTGAQRRHLDGVEVAVATSPFPPLAQSVDEAFRNRRLGAGHADSCHPRVARRRGARHARLGTPGDRSVADDVGGLRARARECRAARRRRSGARPPSALRRRRRAARRRPARAAGGLRAALLQRLLRSRHALALPHAARTLAERARVRAGTRRERGRDDRRGARRERCASTVSTTSDCSSCATASTPSASRPTSRARRGPRDAPRSLRTPATTAFATAVRTPAPAPARATERTPEPGRRRCRCMSATRRRSSAWRTSIRRSRAACIAREALRERGISLRMTLAGNGRDWSRIAALVEARGAGDFVELPGHLSYSRMPDFYRGLDLFLVPRGAHLVAMDTTPLKPLEALACGLPLLVTDLPRHARAPAVARRRALHGTGRGVDGAGADRLRRRAVARRRPDRRPRVAGGGRTLRGGLRGRPASRSAASERPPSRRRRAARRSALGARTARRRRRSRRTGRRHRRWHRWRARVRCAGGTSSSAASRAPAPRCCS